MAKRIDPKLRGTARALRVEGLTIREISERLPVSEGTIAKWVRDISRGDPTALNVHEAPDAPEDPPPAVDEATDADLEDPEERLKMAIREMHNLAKEAQTIGNFTQAARFHSLAAAYSKDLTQIQKRKAADPDVWTAPRRAVDDATRRVRDTIARLVEDVERTGGVVCSHCGRRLRASLASRGADGE